MQREVMGSGENEVVCNDEDEGNGKFICCTCTGVQCQEFNYKYHCVGGLCSAFLLFSWSIMFVLWLIETRDIFRLPAGCRRLEMM